MNKEKRNLIILSAIAIILVVVIVILLLRRKRGNGARMSSSFRANVVENALNEYRDWQYGKLQENNPERLPTLERYWSEGAGAPSYKGKAAVNNPWSAAFVSYVMRKSGAGSDFPYATSHSTYITSSIKNRKEGRSNPFKGYRTNEVRLEPGDIVCFPRAGSGATYDTTGSYASHCDIVVSASGNQAETIGGNVSQTVKKTMVPLTPDGKIDNSKTSRQYFVVIKPEK